MKAKLINYIGKHWRGDLSLSRAFWVNLVLPLCALDLLERLLFPPFIDDQLRITIAIMVYIVVVKLIIYPWQVVGVLRSCARQIRMNTGRLWAIVAQFSVVVSLAIVLISSLEIYQSLQIYKHDQARREIVPDLPEYSLDLVRQATLIHLRC